MRERRYFATRLPRITVKINELKISLNIILTSVLTGTPSSSAFGGNFRLIDTYL